MPLEYNTNDVRLALTPIDIGPWLINADLKYCSFAWTLIKPFVAAYLGNVNLVVLHVCLKYLWN